MTHDSLSAHTDLSNDPSDLDRIYRLLPPVVHLTDERAGRPLQALLRILARQSNIVEEDLRGLYENWFIETCDDWVVPYLGELIGYKLVPENTTLEFDYSERGRARMRAIVPRAEVADTIRFRRRKGSLLLLEELARAAVGWPARAVEYRELIATDWHSRFPSISRGRTLDLRRKDVLRNGYGPFDGATRPLDVRRMNSTLTAGRGNVSSIGLWVWRLKSMLVKAGWAGTGGRTELADHVHRFTFHPFGIIQPLFSKEDRPPEPVGPADEFSVPAPISRRSLAENLLRYYGKDKSLHLTYHLITKAGPNPLPDDILEAFGPICPSRIEVADLTNWENSIPSDHPFRRRDFPSSENQSKTHPYAIVDPELGRMLVRPPIDNHHAKGPKGRSKIKHLEFGVIVRYHYGSAAAVGGGDYPRRIPSIKNPWKFWRVVRADWDNSKSRPEGVFGSLRDALDKWDSLQTEYSAEPRRVVIEIDDDGTFNLGIDTERKSRVTTIQKDEALVIRAAAHRRPTIFASGGEVADYSWTIDGQAEEDQEIIAGSFALEGIVIGGLMLVVSGNLERVAFRDSTFVAAEDASNENSVIELQNLTSCLSIDRCIVVGSIRVDWDEFPSIPITIEARDSILDGAGCPTQSPVISGLDIAPAFASLQIERCTLVGRTHVNRIQLAEDSIFTGIVEVAEPNVGCMRFCSVSTETALAEPATTPRRYTCQPDVFLREYVETHPGIDRSENQWQVTVASQVAPIFSARKFGNPNYMRLADDGPEQISRGSTDESELGAFHDLYLAQRMNLLRTRLAEFTPAGADPAILFST